MSPFVAVQRRHLDFLVGELSQRFSSELLTAQRKLSLDHGVHIEGGLSLGSAAPSAAASFFETSRLRSQPFLEKLGESIQSDAGFVTVQDQSGNIYAGLAYSGYEGRFQSLTNPNSPGGQNLEGDGCSILAILALAVSEHVEGSGELQYQLLLFLLDPN